MSKWYTEHLNPDGELASPPNSGVLAPDTVTIMHGAMYANRTPVSSIGIAPDDIFSLHGDEVMDHDFMEKVLHSGYSRIPVHAGDKQNFVGYLITKKLIAVDEHQNRLLRTMPLRRFLYLKPSDSVLEALNKFQEGVAHIGLVTSTGKEHGRLLKLITLEDALECVLQEEIQDEKDFSREQRALLAFRRLRARKAEEIESSENYVTIANV
jgi:metal transporter CNNM